MINKKTTLAIMVCMSLPMEVSFANNASCGDKAPPLLSVSDFNGDGEVSYSDIKMLAATLYEGKYAALYDRDADGKIGFRDFYSARSELGQQSTKTDQQLAKMYQRFSHFQQVSGTQEVMSMNYLPFGGTFAFHGQHWMNTAGQFAALGLRTSDPFIAEGINVTSDGKSVPALFWGEQAVPLFTDPTAPGGLSTLDWPSPTGVWNSQRVQAFADSPADFFPDTEDDIWHKHAGICLTVQDLGNGPEAVIDQYLSNAECQALPNLQKVEFNGQLINTWGNIWMLHVWAFDLNPNGVFGNTHPCVDPDGPSENDINGGREVPAFFTHHE